VQQFCATYAELYKQNTPPEKFTEAKYQSWHIMVISIAYRTCLYGKGATIQTLLNWKKFVPSRCCYKIFYWVAEALDIAYCGAQAD